MIPAKRLTDEPRFPPIFQKVLTHMFRRDEKWAFWALLTCDSNQTNYAGFFFISYLHIERDIWSKFDGQNSNSFRVLRSGCLPWPVNAVERSKRADAVNREVLGRLESTSSRLNQCWWILKTTNRFLFLWSDSDI